MIEHNPRQKEFFNEVAENWDEMHARDSEKLEFIVDLLGLKGGEKVLDVGTGTGVMIPHLSGKVGREGRILGIDYSKNMIKRAREKFPKEEYDNVCFIWRDVMTLEMNGQYDIILCYSCFPHFIDQKKTLLHLYQGLRRGGRLLIAHSDSREAINNLHSEADRAVEKDFLPPASVISGWMEDIGLKMKIQIDTDRLFILGGEK